VKESSGTPYRVTFGRLLGFLRPYKVSLAVSIVLAVASQGAQIAVVWVTKIVIDQAITPHDAHKLWLFVWTIVGLGVLRAVLMAARRLISGKQALAVEMDLRQGLYAQLVRLSFGF
jgi:ABC-type multidrug transport system fused ATPase/permease subunit